MGVGVGVGWKGNDNNKGPDGAREGSNEAQGQGRVGAGAATFAQRGLIRIRHSLVHTRNKRLVLGFWMVTWK